MSSRCLEISCLAACDWIYELSGTAGNLLQQLALGYIFLALLVLQVQGREESLFGLSWQ